VLVDKLDDVWSGKARTGPGMTGRGLALPQLLVSLLDSGRSHQWSTLWPQRDSKAQSRRPGCKYIPRPRWSMRLPRSAAPAGPKAGNPQTPSLMLAGGPSVDVELVALGVLQRDRVVVKALL
jgi:hypothetical protein